MMDTHRKTMLMFMALAIVMTACPTGVRGGCCCPTFWTAFGQHCYRFFAYDMTWQEAETHCQSFTVPSFGSGGVMRDSLGHLVSIHSQAEHNFVATLFESSRKKESTWSTMWIGLHDRTSEGHFLWSDGTTLNFTNWAGRNPDNWGSGEDCTEIRSPVLTGWNDLACGDNGHYFVCKLPAW